MMFERIQMGKRLTPNRIRARRALFTLRNMLKVRYQYGQFDREQIYMRVNPRSFMMGLGYGSTAKSQNPLKLTMLQESEISMEMKNELKRVDTQGNMPFKNE